MKVLITGGSGLIGGAVTALLLKEGHQVVHISRHPNQNARVKQYRWDTDRLEVDTECLSGTDAIINLAGATLNHRWTADYKSLILRSRVDGTRLLFNTLQAESHQVKTLISASASGYYPHSYQNIFSEDDAPGNDFMALVCQKWEMEAQNFENLGIRTVRGRIGIVLSDEDGALPAMAKPVRFGLGAPLGSGRQFMSWIHIDDLARMFVHALKNNELSGPYNFVGPEVVSNREMTRAIARVLRKPLFFFFFPAVALRLALGEMSEIVLRSNGLTNTRISESGFQYEYRKIDDALTDLLK